MELVSLAAGFFQAQIQNLIDRCKKEISQIRDFDKNAAKLTKSLETIQKYLNDAETRNITSEDVKDWLKNLEDVAFEADNVLDELNYRILSDQIKTTEKRKVPYFNHSSRSRYMAIKIREINEKLESINKEAAELGLVGRLADEPALLITTLETDSFSDDPIFIGRNDDESKIVGMLTNSITTAERKVSIISIVGMGGLGKTTLTRKVFNHEKMESRFGLRIWVHVSPNFDAMTLFKKILNKLTSYPVEIADRQDILSKLQEKLKDKTYLLILDDVWNEDPSKWKDFMDSLSGVSSVKENAIVVTTRSKKVATVVNPLHIHELKGLSVEECWKIIKEKAFVKEDIPSELEAMGRKIAKRCQSLPLVANVVGGILSNQSEEKWRSIEEKWLSADEGGDNITNILRPSFDNLSPPLLKKCFSYCAMFPKGFKIMKRELIEMWMAEGFLQADGRDDMESMGEKFINVLLHNSLLQVSKGDYYGMHDLVHDLACSVSSSSNSTGGSSQVRYMTLGDNFCGDESSRIPKEMAKSLRTLLITSTCDISDINFSDLESLHVLRLDSEVKELPSSIQKLIHLRDFDISKSEIEVLPDWIGEFFHLQTLRVNRKLRKLPMGIGRLTSLQTLTHFPVGDENGCKIEELRSLINLKGKLWIHNLERVHDKEEAAKANLFKKSKILELYLDWSEDREGETNDEGVLEGLQPHSNLRELRIGGFNGKRFPLWTQKMSVRDAPQGSWVVLNKLMSLSLFNCKECEEIPMLGHLPNLKSLKLKGLSNLKSINSSFYGMVNKETTIAFPALENLILERMPKLAEWAEIDISDGSEVKVFPRLQHLVIKWCEQLMSVPSHVSSCLQHLTIHKIGVECLPPDWLFSNNQITLSYLDWSEDREGETNDEDVLEGLQPHSDLREIRIHGFNGKRFPLWTQKMSVRDAPQGSWVVLNQLMSLSLSKCKECEEIPMLGQLPNLKSLELNGLSNLKCINSSFYGMVNKDTRIVFPALEQLELKDMPNLAEWAEIEISDGSEVKLFPRLQHLKIENCKQLMSVPSHVSSCLEYLRIHDIGVECLQADWLFSNSETLFTLYIRHCPNLREISDRGGEQSQGRSFTSLPIFPRLTHLEIMFCEQLMSVPSLVSSCLEELEIRSIDVEYLPGDWFLSSNKTLSKLVISSCPKLREISDKGGEQSQGRSFTSLPIIFARLKHLEIRWCEQLMSVPSLVSSCLEELEISGIGVEYLRGDWFLSSNQTLSKLDIKHCPNLREISDRGGEQSQGRSFTSLPIFPRLTHLEIKCCEQLMSVPSLASSCLEELEICKIGVEYLPGDWFLSSNQTLSKLVIRECPNLREISNRGGEQSQGRSFTSLPIFPRLTHLKIMFCEQLMSVTSLVSTCLEELEIGWIGVEYLPGDWFLSSNQTLSKLVIRYCPNLREISDRGGEQSQGRSFTITSLPIFPRLTHLTIWNCEQLISVPSLASSCLEELEICKIGVEYLPGDWFLSSNQTLSRLEISFCPNLREISDRGGEQSQGTSFTSLPIFPRLTHLKIMFCEQLMSVPSLVSTCLEELEIYKIGVEYLPGDWFLSSNQTLSKLVIMNCPNLREISERGGEQSQGRSFTSLPIFPRLTDLIIYGVPKLNLVTVAAMRRLQIDGDKNIIP